MWSNIIAYVDEQQERDHLKGLSDCCQEQILKIMVDDTIVVYCSCCGRDIKGFEV